ncbi:MAG: HDOD domain-containing protein [Pseudomonadota bacterium]|nr:HDOD domain-containing protein [Pseudomonadota bacterium]
MLNASAAPTYKSGKTSVSPATNASPEEARAAALQFLAQLATEVSSGTVDLPCFPDVVLRIRKALSDPKNTPEKTVTIVGAEPRLAARLLQTANSAAFNARGKPLTDLRAAITRLGHQLVQSAAMAFAVQHMRDEASLRSIAKPLSVLWKDSISVALLCQMVAKRTKVIPEEAFLTGLLHGIGRLYIMVRAIGIASDTSHPELFLELVSGWQASIGKAVLENWGFAEEMCEAVANQSEYERKRRHEADLSDVLIVSIVLGETLKMPAPRVVDIEGINAFLTIGLTAEDYAKILTEAEGQLGTLQSSLG